MNIFSAQTRANSLPPSPVSYSMRPTRMTFHSSFQTPAPTQPAISTPPVIPKVKWGEPTWFLLHTLSVKIKDSEFGRVRQDLLNKIYAICTNLPCPTCSQHAKTYLDGINFNSIQTKEDLIKMLFVFHNSVNQR